MGISAATDVTGYSFLGHLSEMLEPDGLGAMIRHADVPTWEKAVPLAADGCYPGGLVNNRDYIGDAVTADGVTREDLLPLYDPQTSGGLLIAVAEERRGRSGPRIGGERHSGGGSR